MKNYTKRISEMLEPLEKTMSSYMNNLVESMIQSAQSVVKKMNELFNEAEEI